MRKFICYIIISLSLTSCSDFLSIDPLTTLSPNSFWKSESDLKLALNILYTNINTSYSDDNRSADTFGSGADAISSGTYVPPNTDAVWNTSYDMIRVANDFLENCDYANVSDDIKKRYIAEARFFRAYYYFNLLKRFGNIILIDKTLDLSSPELSSKQADKSLVWDFIINDLSFASEYLPNKSSLLEEDKGRITKGAALAFLSRCALYAGTYYKFHEGVNYDRYLQISKNASKKVIDSQEYSLYSNYRDLFLTKGEDSDEIILSYRYSEELGIINNRPRKTIYDFDCEPTKYLADAFLCSDGLPVEKSSYNINYLPLGEEFKYRDPRMSLTLWKPGDLYNNEPFVPNLYNQTKTGYMFKKYGVESAYTYDPSVVYVDNILIRYAEVLLNYAESTFELSNEITDDDLNLSINALRNRFDGYENKLPNITNDFVNKYGLNMRDEIRRERRVELAGEAFRYDDIIRWKIADKELNRSILGAKFDVNAYPNIKPGIDITLDDNGFILVQSSSSRTFNSDKDYLYPIPLRELSLNSNLSQNAGW